MKKLFTIAAVIFALSGCYQVTSAGDINKALAICKDRGGINNISVRWDSYEHVTCQDEFASRLHRHGE